MAEGERELRPAAAEANPIHLLALGLALSLFLILIARRAWVSDDAYITFRTIDNWLHGYGLTWNVGERVQAYTHPLWMLLMSGAVLLTREFNFTSMFVSLALAWLAVWLFTTRIAGSASAALLGLAILVLSKSFTDYATSGLENPLTYLLMAIFFARILRPGRNPASQEIFWLAGIAGLAMLTRLDTALIYLPALAVLFGQNRSRRSLGMLVLGLSPVFLWEAFSLFYYGFPFPNTAYAKLNSGIPQGEMIRQGLFYLLNAVEFDPLTPTAILAGLMAGLAAPRWQPRMLVIGIALYLLYVVWIGGDFMSGRYLAAPLFGAVFLIAQMDFSAAPGQAIAAAFAAVLILGLRAPHNPFDFNDYLLRQAPPQEFVDSRGISDERLNYQLATGLLMASRENRLPDHVWAWQGTRDRNRGRDVVAKFAVGFYGFHAGPDIYVLDQLGLGDPLLARLPAARDIHWRIGHFVRAIPDGYLKTLQEGQNRLKDDDLARYYDQLALITRGPLLSRTRLLAIWRMNTGQYDTWIDFERHRYPEMLSLRLADLKDPAPALEMESSGASITIGAGSQAAALSISLDSNDEYQIVFLQGGNELAHSSLPAPFYPEEGLAVHQVAVPQAAQQSGFDEIRVFPRFGEQPFRLGAVKLHEP